MFDVSQVLELHERTVAQWHEREPSNPYQGFLHLVCEQHKFNFLLWHEEDVARSPDVGDARIASVKRAIDRYNQQRNDAIERLDDWLCGELHERGVLPRQDAKRSTETPGSAIDRLSILALRLYHMQEQADRPEASAEHRATAQGKLRVLTRQRSDLAAALADLVSDIATGKQRLTVYRQFKMYNDPALNPYLNGQQRKAG
ncbi:MAG: DUF4254 domain-containing protein [Pirellulales bacterium]